MADIPTRGSYLFVLEVNTPARHFYERLGGHNGGVSTTETHGGAVVQSCRYVWARADRGLPNTRTSSGVVMESLDRVVRPAGGSPEPAARAEGVRMPGRCSRP